MKGAAFKWGAVVVFCCGLAGQALAGEANVTDRDRSFRNFTRDTATVGDRRIRLEVRGFTLEDDRDVEVNIAGLPIEKVQRDLTNSQPGTLPRVSRVQGGVIDLLGSYGLGDRAEVGFDVPYLFETVDVVDVNSGSGYTKNSQDVGDTILYGKFKRQMAEHWALALGMELSMPTGIEKKWLGTGEFGFNPFISTRYQRGRLGGEIHVGYQIYTGDEFKDVLNYSGVVYARGSEHYLLRVEVSGRYFDAFGRRLDDVVLMPGLDFNFSDSITIRPTGLTKITDNALDWGIGLGLAVTL
jgi:hypothetical protein